MKVVRKQVAALFYFIAMMMYAQEYTPRFGIKVGENFSFVTKKREEQVAHRATLHFGVLLEVPLTEVLAFQPEIVYSPQGATIERITAEGMTSHRLQLDYLNVPLLFKYYVFKGTSIQVGPQVGILLTGNSEKEIFRDGAKERVTQHISGVTPLLDLGTTVGIGYQMPQGFFGEVRYYLGLSTSYDDMTHEMRNAVFQLACGFKF
ncbi:porin family protein [Aquimarina hainanensis]|uniref:Porin family protein n=1 Tax=Aquimarina hainanensis TaxID=1578017 RepID=A0ABW5NCW3_9FLAO|nr:porin family protein [Aquimarina sp. TRL1]QKX03620.1 PorT family protein [Aquimarina sp. TRL1]